MKKYRLKCLHNDGCNCRLTNFQDELVANGRGLCYIEITISYINFQKKRKDKDDFSG